MFLYLLPHRNDADIEWYRTMICDAEWITYRTRFLLPDRTSTKRLPSSSPRANGCHRVTRFVTSRFPRHLSEIALNANQYICIIGEIRRSVSPIDAFAPVPRDFLSISVTMLFITFAIYFHPVVSPLGCFQFSYRQNIV